MWGLKQRVGRMTPLLSRLTERNHELTLGGVSVCSALDSLTTLKF